jgi:hypothetical protein
MDRDAIRPSRHFIGILPNLSTLRIVVARPSIQFCHAVLARITSSLILLRCISKNGTNSLP